jgi:NlpC/P60 family
MMIDDGGAIAAGALREAERLAGLQIPYRWGGNTLNGMDCSGFMQWIFSVGGYPNLPRDRRRWTTATLRLLADPIPRGQERPGDLIFPSVTHVGIYIGPNRFIDAQQTGTFVGVHDYTRYNRGQYSVYRLVTPYTGAGGYLHIPIDDDNPAAQTIGGLVAAVNGAIAAPITWLTQPENWIRIGMMLGGVMLVLFGVISLQT